VNGTLRRIHLQTLITAYSIKLNNRHLSIPVLTLLEYWVSGKWEKRKNVSTKCSNSFLTLPWNVRFGRCISEAYRRNDHRMNELQRLLLSVAYLSRFSLRDRSFQNGGVPSCQIIGCHHTGICIQFEVFRCGFTLGDALLSKTPVRIH
jgi:hypothetical protein